jgi:hypothetical protein
MSNYSITRTDLTSEVREELYDGTARITNYDADGLVASEVLVPSDEQPPEPEPVPVDPVVVEDFASAMIDAQTMQELRDAAQALLDALGGA